MAVAPWAVVALGNVKSTTSVAAAARIDLWLSGDRHPEEHEGHEEHEDTKSIIGGAASVSLG